MVIVGCGGLFYRSIVPLVRLANLTKALNHEFFDADVIEVANAPRQWSGWSGHYKCDLGRGAFAVMRGHAYQRGQRLGYLSYREAFSNQNTAIPVGVALTDTWASRDLVLDKCFDIRRSENSSLFVSAGNSGDKGWATFVWAYHQPHTNIWPTTWCDLWQGDRTPDRDPTAPRCGATAQTANANAYTATALDRMVELVENRQWGFINWATDEGGIVRFWDMLGPTGDMTPYLTALHAPWGTPIPNVETPPNDDENDEEEPGWGYRDADSEDEEDE